MTKRFLLLLFVCQIAIAQDFQLIPMPVKFEYSAGEVTLGSKSMIEYVDAFATDEGDFFIEYVQKNYDANELQNPRYIRVEQDFKNKEPGSYSILVKPEQDIYIAAADAEGVFHAFQTLLQLLPTDSKTPSIPAVSIYDEPKFKWRGMHLDCARHFWSVDFVKKYIDHLAMYKMNTFHWHLTDDQGWRIEIKRYPKLTEVGSKRSGTMAGHYNEQRWDNIPYGGFYTQEQIKEVVAYAKKRHITIVPEIEMPGHAVAALAAYPELACTPGPFEVEKTWGVFDDVFCPKENTFKFFEGVLTEVIALFPSEYIHIGGDECPKTRWKTCEHCQKLIRDKNLKDEHGLQSYFIQRVEKFVNSKGRKIIGWDEILEGGLAPNAAVMSWRGIDGGIAAARQKHNVVMTPEGYLYFDRYQGDPKNEPLGFGGYVPIEKVYGFNPIPDALSADEAKYIIGVQANLWTEYIATEEHAEYMIFPRIAALSEVAWGTSDPDNFKQFQKRLFRHLSLLDKLGVNYAKSMFQVATRTFPFGKRSVALELSSAGNNPEIRYTNDGSEPTVNSQYFPGKIIVPASQTVKAARFENGKRISAITQQQFTFSKATGRQITLENQPSDKYKGDGSFTLVNGILGDKQRTGRDWIAFAGTDLEAVIDLSDREKISSVTASFMQSQGSWIYYPVEVEVLVSKDNRNFKSVARVTAAEIAKSGGTIKMKFKNQKAQFVKIIAKNTKTIADGNPGAGNPAWLFTDEILID
ncbi:MAG: beta-N-acetylhexosaminidase [Flavobacterium sp.]|uniref:glycoside hydrolase family 20 protein n=1 Tax=Flavobacterium sp. TaxID=239 RepID=UPI0012273A07|nr:family 20 glycosylhydrolase [Flavobacterium sp.]RZJ66452.1 MAG: beta-N-acetylhexosaminidase [Flavobacterium sp.]